MRAVAVFILQSMGIFTNVSKEDVVGGRARDLARV
jgi:hypothetical protein